MIKTINETIQQYQTLIDRKPIKLSLLRAFINGKRKKEVSSAGARNTFIGNNDIYKNNYISVARDHYVPKEKFNSKDSIVKYLSSGNDYMFDGLSLGYDLEINVQNIIIDSYIIFGQKQNDDRDEFFNRWIKARYIDIKQPTVKNDFKLLYKLNMFNDDNALSSYMDKSNISFDDARNAYYNVSKNTNLIDTEIKNVGKKLWGAEAWAKSISK